MCILGTYSNQFMVHVSAVGTTPKIFCKTVMIKNVTSELMNLATDIVSQAQFIVKLSHLSVLNPFLFFGIENTDSIPWAFKTFKAERKKKPVLVSWIHSHVRGAECYFSSIDCHTQHTYEKVHNGVLGLVVEIMENCQKGVHHFFEMTG